MPFWNCWYASGWGGACGGREDDEDAWSYPQCPGGNAGTHSAKKKKDARSGWA